MQIPITCPGCHNSPKSIIDDSHLSLLLAPEEHEQYLRQSLRLGATGLLTCPQPNCQGLVEMVPPYTNFVCPVCAFQLCTACKVPWHAGMTCEKYQGWKQENETGDRRMEEMERLGQIKRCPVCTNGVVKSQGCNHMTCRCGCHFCFICGADIGRANPYAHFNTTRACPLFEGQ